MPRILGNIIKFLLFLGVGMAILYYLYHKQQAAYLEECLEAGNLARDCQLIDKLIDDFRNANFFWLLMVVLSFMLSNISRAIRWRMLLRPMGYEPRLHNAFMAIMVGYFTNLFLPRVGEVLRASTLSRYEHIPVERAMGTIVTDRALDVICIVLMTLGAMVLAGPHIFDYLRQQAGEKFNDLLSILLWVAVAGLVALALLWVFRRQLLASRWGRKLRELALGFWEGISSVRQVRQPGLLVLHSALIWVFYYLITYLCFQAYPPTAGLSPLAALVVFVFGAWGIVIPSPGGMGTYHFLSTEALAIYGVPRVEGFSWSNICFFAVQFGGNVFFGLLSLAFLTFVNRRYEPDHITEPSQ